MTRCAKSEATMEAVRRGIPAINLRYWEEFPGGGDADVDCDQAAIAVRRRPPDRFRVPEPRLLRAARQPVVRCAARGLPPDRRLPQPGLHLR
ncbi:MAG: hypothetical protein R3F11_15070 [Verrucomicrobiales bacterium]